MDIQHTEVGSLQCLYLRVDRIWEDCKTRGHWAISLCGHKKAERVQ